jgi:hypothetical protein
MSTSFTGCLAPTSATQGGRGSNLSSSLMAAESSIASLIECATSTTDPSVDPALLRAIKVVAHASDDAISPSTSLTSSSCVPSSSALSGSTVGSFADQPSARSPVTDSTIERTNTRLVGSAGTQKPHQNTQFTRTSTRRKMNSVLDGDKRRGAYAPISWLYFTGLVNIQRRST